MDMDMCVYVRASVHVYAHVCEGASIYPSCAGEHCYEQFHITASLKNYQYRNVHTRPNFG